MTGKNDDFSNGKLKKAVDTMISMNFNLKRSLTALSLVGLTSAALAGSPPLDFAYRVMGDYSVKPVLVFNDGKDTFIQPQEGVTGLKVNGENPTREGPYFVVRGIASEIVLTADKGKRTVEKQGEVATEAVSGRVVITHPKSLENAAREVAQQPVTPKVLPAALLSETVAERMAKTEAQKPAQEREERPVVVKQATEQSKAKRLRPRHDMPPQELLGDGEVRKAKTTQPEAKAVAPTPAPVDVAQPAPKEQAPAAKTVAREPKVFMPKVVPALEQAAAESKDSASATCKAGKDRREWAFATEFKGDSAALSAAALEEIRNMVGKAGEVTSAEINVEGKTKAVTVARGNSIRSALLGAGVPMAAIKQPTNHPSGGIGSEVNLIREITLPCVGTKVVKLAGLDGLATIIWRGAPADLIKQMADQLGYAFSVEGGNPNHLNVVVAAVNVPLQSAMQAIGNELGAQADLIVKRNELVLKVNGGEE